MFFSGILLLFNDPVDICNLISGSSALSKSSLNIWKFSVQVLLKPGLENFEYYFARVWSEVKSLSRDSVDCSLPGSSGYGILQARILECLAISFSIARVWDECNCVVV